MRGTNQNVSKGFLQEIYEKEVRIRLKYFAKNKEIVRTAASFRAEPKNYGQINVHHTQAVAELNITERDQVLTAALRKNKAPAPTFSESTLYFTRKEEHVDQLTKNKEEYAKAVADSEKIKLDRLPARRGIKGPVEYNGVTANDKRKGDEVMRPIDKSTKDLMTEGSKEYFRKRYQMKPEDKYYYPQSTNWQYGWRLQDSSIKMMGPAHGRVRHLGTRARPKVGLQPDPWYYGDPHQLSSVRPTLNCII